MVTDRDWSAYFRVALFLPTQLDAVESALESESDGWLVAMKETAHRFPMTYDQLFEVLFALSGVGVLEEVDRRSYRLSKDVLCATRPVRASARAALAWAKQNLSTDLCEVLLAVPPSGYGRTDLALDRSFLGLRTAVRSLIACATRRLVLASPFWDPEVATELGVLLERRLTAGVTVTVLARAAAAESPSGEALRLLGGIRSGERTCDIRILDQPSQADPFGSSTFHFKVACADGERVYLGSANFNTAGLASRWELGVLLEGVRARLVASLVDSLVRAAVPFRAS